MLTKTEALAQLRLGQKLTHASFTPKEWVKTERFMYQFEDGCMCTPGQFWEYRQSDIWESNWSIWEEKTKYHESKNINNGNNG